MLIFLDLDGVLRREGAPLYRLEPELLARFEGAVRELPGAEIVIASSWREVFRLAEIRAHFSPDIAARIIGMTPIARNNAEHCRYREVAAFMQRRALAGRPWVALDDDPAHYPARDNVRVLSPVHGFDDEAASWVVGMGRRAAVVR